MAKGRVKNDVALSVCCPLGHELKCITLCSMIGAGKKEITQSSPLWNHRKKARMLQLVTWQQLKYHSYPGGNRRKRLIARSKLKMKEANLRGSPPAGISSLKQIKHSPCRPKNGCFKRMRAQQRSRVNAGKWWSQSHPWKETGYPRNLNNKQGGGWGHVPQVTRHPSRNLNAKRQRGAKLFFNSTFETECSLVNLKMVYQCKIWFHHYYI